MSHTFIKSQNKTSSIEEKYNNKINDLVQATDKLYSLNISNKSETHYKKLIKDIINDNQEKKSENIIGEEKENKELKDSKNNKEIRENRFSIRNLLEKNNNQLSFKKNFFVISNEIDNNEDISWKIKKDILQTKMMNDKLILNDNTFNKNFYDKISNEIYLGFSSEARYYLNNISVKDDDNNILNKEMFDNNEYNFKEIHNLIKFKKEDYSLGSNTVISNNMIMNLCSGFIKLNDIFQEDLNLKDLSKSNLDSSNDDNTVLYNNDEISNKTIEDISVDLDEEEKNKKLNDIDSLNKININIDNIDNKDELLNYKDLDILEDFIKEEPDSLIANKVKSFLDLIKYNIFEGKEMQISNIQKNIMIKELKEEYIKSYEEITGEKYNKKTLNLEKKKTNKYVSRKTSANNVSKSTLKKKKQKLKYNNPFLDNYDVENDSKLIKKQNYLKVKKSNSVLSSASNLKILNNS